MMTLKNAVFGLTIYLASCIGLLSANATDLPVFPGAVGFGTQTVAGSGRHLVKPRSRVYKVSNLNSSGSGSLRECAEASGPRVCVFEVSGTITLSSDLDIDNGYLTIAGQTAPSPGITLRGAGIEIESSDVLIQHIRIRVGDAGSGVSYSNRDGLQILGDDETTKNVVIDHCSISWAIDENVQPWGYIENITISNSIISEALHDSKHPKGPHSKGMIVGDGIASCSVINNLFAHNDERNPLFNGDNTAVIVNNVVYNYGTTAIQLAQEGTAYPSFISIVGNAFIRGPDWGDSMKPVWIRNDVANGTKVYIHDNAAIEYKNTDPWTIAEVDVKFNPKASTPQSWPTSLNPKPSNIVRDWVLLNAGARPADRDSVDRRIVEDVTKISGKIIDSQNEVGGWPKLEENYRPLSIPSDPDGDDDGDRYTNLEEWLHHFANQVEKVAGIDSGPPHPPKGFAVKKIWLD